MNVPTKPAHRRLRKLRSLLLNIGLVVAVFLAVTAYQSRNMLDTGGETAPGLHGTTLAGEPYDLGNAGGRPALVYFFAPWCKVCAASAGNLERLRRWRDESELQMVAVALSWNSVEEVRDYVERHELDLPVVLQQPARAVVARLARRLTRLYLLPSRAAATLNRHGQ